MDDIQGSPAPLWRIDLKPGRGVEFCVWALQRDGLQVAPFDKHPPGDGFLQAAGLNAELWKFWFTEAVIGQRIPGNTSLAMIGTATLRQRLQGLWPLYLSDTARKHSHRNHLFGFRLGTSEFLNAAVAPLQGKIPELRIHGVQYPVVVPFVVPPASIVLGLDRERSSEAEVHEGLLVAIKKLIM